MTTAFLHLPPSFSSSHPIPCHRAHLSLPNDRSQVMMSQGRRNEETTLAEREREREREDIFRATLVEVEVGIPSGRHRVRPRMERLGDTMGTAEGGESAPPPLMAPITHRWILHILCERGGEGMYGCHFFGGGACITGALFSFRCKIVLRRLLRPSARRSFCVWGEGGSSSYGWLWCKQAKRRRERGCGGDVDGAPRRRRRRRRESWSRAALCHSPPQ